MAGGRLWTKEEDDFLRENVGKLRLQTLAEKLGRTVEAVDCRLCRLGIAHTKAMTGRLTANELANLVGMEQKAVLRWIRNHGLPAKRKAPKLSQIYHLISPEDFWKWAERNKERIDFSRIKPDSIPPEPEWVEEEREKDRRTIPKRRREPWTPEEEGKMQQMIALGYSYAEIAEELGRTYSGVAHRINKIQGSGKAKVPRRKIAIPWTDEEVQLMLELERKGYDDESIAYSLGREKSHIVYKRSWMREKGLYRRKRKEIGKRKLDEVI